MENISTNLDILFIGYKGAMEDTSMSEESVTINSTALHSVQSTRNLPNILRNGNTKHYKNNKMPKLDETITFLISEEEIQTSFTPNKKLPGNFERESRNTKIASSKLHHQRKQVHNPLDIQYDICNSNDNNNNNDKDILPTTEQIDRLYLLHNLSDNKEYIPKKKIKSSNKHKNNECKHLFNEKSQNGGVGKRSHKAKVLDKKSDLDSEFNNIPDINMMNIVMQNDDFPLSDIAQSVSELDTSNYINNIDNKDEKLDELSKTFSNNCDNKVWNFEEIYDMNCNTVIDQATKLGATQHKTHESSSNYELPVTKDLMEHSVNRNVKSNFLFASNVLYCTCTNCMSSSYNEDIVLYENTVPNYASSNSDTCISDCTCANCMSSSYDKDIVLYEDTVPNYTSSNSDTEYLTSCIYNLYTSDYYRIFDDNWLKEYSEDNFYFQEVEKMGIMNEDTSIGDVNKLVENNSDIPTSIHRNESQNLQCGIDRIQDICMENPKKFATPSNESAKFLVPTEHIKLFDETEYLDLHGISMEETIKVTPQNDTPDQTIVSTDKSVFKSKPQKKRHKDGKGN